MLQPTYWARTHVWNRIMAADVFIWLDSVKFARSSTKWEDRTVVETPDGRPVVLRLPASGPREVSWREVGLHSGWAKHRRTLQSCYGRRPHWRTVSPFVDEVYTDRADTIEAVCWRTLQATFRLLRMSRPVVRASELPVPGAKSELVLQLVKAVGGTTYLTGRPGASYLDLERFTAAGVAVEVQNWNAPVTRHGLVNPSIIHVLAEHGPVGTGGLLAPDPLTEPDRRQHDPQQTVEDFGRPGSRRCQCHQWRTDPRSAWCHLV
ncbi:WbqC family protein [Streptomyces sp. NPDC057620]|uniref:WbqC family protein n=1 Tax=Streptomyces sp. NPDC057620 TaxID=3346185 RepID=UPI0036790A6E